MDFEYDAQKSASNKIKHGIDFEEAQQLWDGRTTVIPLRGGHGEERQAVFGLIAGKHWTAITTMRRDAVRIISMPAQDRTRRNSMTAKKKISVEEFDKVFDEGKEDILDYLDLDKAQNMPPRTYPTKKVTSLMPEWVLDEAEKLAEYMAVSRSAVLNMWLVEKAAEAKKQRLA